MENPVILPQSRATIDLSTIKAHLLSDPTDPFNRSPLKLEEVVPSEFVSEFRTMVSRANSLADIDLKNQIEAFNHFFVCITLRQKFFCWKKIYHWFYLFLLLLIWFRMFRQ